jgi:hypothetical protein
MPRVSVGMGPSNDPIGRSEVLRLGTSSSISGDRQDRSGDSAPETEPSLQSPVPSADSPSSTGQPPKPTLSSASSMDGSTQETGYSQPSQQDSSEEQATPKDPGQEAAPEFDNDQYLGLSGHEIMQLARQAYVDRQYDQSDALIGLAETTGGVPDAELSAARRYVAVARGRSALGGPPSDTEPITAGPSEAVPADGGYLTGA